MVVVVVVVVVGSSSNSSSTSSSRSSSSGSSNHDLMHKGGVGAQALLVLVTRPGRIKERMD